ncbi:TPA: hypothetical protein QIM42_001045 [Enterobacter ludwigii]|nr:hypothetical protein [Enterobacter ludwigii]
MKTNDAPRIIIQLMLSALLFYLYSFKFKSILLPLLSEQVYYQVLIILVILSGYLARWIDDFRSLVCHGCMMLCSKTYKLKHLKKGVKDLEQKTESAKLSETAQAMMVDITSSDFELETHIKSMHSEIQKLKNK